MNKLFTVALSVLLSLAVVSTSTAQEGKVVAVVSATSFDGLLGAASDIGQLIGMPVEQQFAAQLQQATQGKGLAGFDRTRPFGAAVFFDDSNMPYVLGFLPVDDFAALSGLLPPPAQLQDGPNGTKTLQIPFGPMLVMKSQDKWLYITNEPARLDNLPKDPTDLLAGLPEKYAIGMRANIQNIPEPVRQQWIAMAQGIVGAGAAGFSQGDLQALSALGTSPEDLIKHAERFLTETDYLETGIRLDESTKNLSLELTMTAVPGSDLAQDLSIYKSSPTKYSDFLKKDALFSLLVNLDGKPSDSTVDALTNQKKLMLETVQLAIQGDGLPEKVQTTVIESVTALIETAFDTAYGGNFEGGAIVMTKPKPALVAGGSVTDSAAVEKALKDLYEIAKEEEDFPEIEWDAKKLLGHSLHQVTIPVTDEEAMKALGEEVTIILAVSKESMFIAAGNQAESALKKVISGSGSSTPQPAIQGSLSIKKILEVVAAGDEEAPIQELLGALDGDQDHVRLTSMAVPQGVKTTITVESGLIKLAGVSYMQAQKAAAQFQMENQKRIQEIEALQDEAEKQAE